MKSRVQRTGQEGQELKQQECHLECGLGRKSQASRILQICENVCQRNGLLFS